MACSGKTCRNCSGCGSLCVSSSVSVEERKKNDGLNLSRIRKQLKKKLGWTDLRVNTAESGYRRFLALVQKDGGRIRRRPFSEDMDQFWHFHILDTAKYTKDCQRFFGFYLHHKPE